MAQHVLQPFLEAKSNSNLRWQAEQCNVTSACLGVVPSAGEDVDLDWHPPLAVALQLADLAAQDLEALADVQAVQVQHDGACRQHTCSWCSMLQQCINAAYDSEEQLLANWPSISAAG